SPWFQRPSSPGDARRVNDRKLDDEGRAAARLAVDRDGAAVGLDDVSADVEAETQPAVVAHWRGALEASEQALEVFRADADATVLDREAHRDAVPLHVDVDGLAGAVLDGVE